jgi:hypothetical protein
MNNQLAGSVAPPVQENKRRLPVPSGSARKPWILGSLAIVWGLLTFPPMLLSQWFPMDLPFVYYMGAHLDEWLPWIVSPYNGSGRYFPVYWLYNCLQYLVFGNAVWPYFLVQSVIFLASATLASRILLRMTGSIWVAAFLFIAIYINSPVAENLTTLGKGEPLSFFFVVCILATFHERSSRDKPAWLDSVAVSLLFALALWTKETALVLLGFAATGLVISGALQKSGWARRETTPVRPYLILFVALLAGFGIARLPYLLFPATTHATSYTDYAITSKLVIDNATFYVTQQPDVIVFGILSLAFLLLAGKRLVSVSTPSQPDNARNLVFAISLCAMAWAYWLALLLWRWPMAYYMLLPGIVFRLCAIYGLYVLAKQGLIKRSTYKAWWGGLVIALVYAALCVYYIASSQIAYSRVYTHALKQFQSAAPEKSTLVVESYPFFAEQISGTRSFLTHQLHMPAKISGIADLLNPSVVTPEMLSLLKVTRTMLDENMKALPKKGDYVLAFTGNKLATWFLRGVTPYYSEDSFLKKEGAYDMELVAGQQIVTPAIYPHVWTHLPAAGETSLGYKLYKVLEDKPKFFWKGRYPDGWVGSESSVMVNPSYGKPIVVKLSVPAYALPSTIRVSRDGNLLEMLTVSNTDEITLHLGEAPADSTVITFDVPKTVVPKKLNLNSDDRALGARLSLDPPGSSVKR